MINLFYKKQFLLYSLLIFLIAFNGYYFFIRRDVGPLFYLDKVLYGQKDYILEKKIYKDLSEDYFHLNRLNTTKNTVFIGDSIVKRFNFQEFFSDFHILNRGIYSDTTAGVLKRLDININNLLIDKLFIMIGYNDLDYRTDDEIVKNIFKIIENIKADKIYLHSILPVNASRHKINQRIISINDMLKDRCPEYKAKYIDLHSHFYLNYGLHPKFSNDGVHPNHFGYKLWHDVLQDYIRN
jgi:lysophospholipase L1-like esterase